MITSTARAIAWMDSKALPLLGHSVNYDQFSVEHRFRDTRSRRSARPSASAPVCVLTLLGSILCSGSGPEGHLARSVCDFALPQRGRTAVPRLASSQ